MTVWVTTLIALALQPVGSDPGLPERLVTQPEFRSSLSGFMLVWLFVGAMILWPLWLWIFGGEKPDGRR